ncbi:MAG: transglutaminase family protein [Planctomycetaceae bacterium]|jgi:transglutaminase-like putative cysteine protease|nr:transglutaminase family protein [Planctomycetaceae bacterium]
MSVWIRCRYELIFDLPTSTPFVFTLRPRSGGHQWISRQDFHLSPQIIAEECEDLFGNLCQRLVAPAGEFTLKSETLAQTDPYDDEHPDAGFIPVPALPASVMGFLAPSRYCESDCLGELAADITAGYQPGYSQAAAIVNWLKQNIDFQPGSSNTLVSALQVKERGFGVCRDMAHLGIALCRALSIPSRMVAGYFHGLEPMDMHAWFEIYVGNRWYTFDPTQSNLQGARLTIAYGRDAADVATFTQFGEHVIPTREFVSVEQFASQPD